MSAVLSCMYASDLKDSIRTSPTHRTRRSFLISSARPAPGVRLGPCRVNRPPQGNVRIFHLMLRLKKKYLDTLYEVVVKVAVVWASEKRE